MLLVGLVALAELAAPIRAEAAVELLPRAAREVSREESASRDAPVFQAAYGPKSQVSLGAEHGLVRLALLGVTLRLGASGLVAIEDRVSPRLFPPNEYWRGLVAGEIAASFDAWARRWIGPSGALEAVLRIGHESDHPSAEVANGDFGFPPPLPFHRGDIHLGGSGELGEYVAPGIAVRTAIAPNARLSLISEDRLFFHGALSHAPGLDAIFRTRLTAWAWPVLSFYGESPVPRAPATHLAPNVRAMLGCALVGAGWELFPFVAIEGGYGNGWLINQQGTKAQGGLRFIF